MLRKRTTIILFISIALCVLAAGAYGIGVYILHEYQMKLANESERLALARGEERQRVELARTSGEVEAARAELTSYFVADEDIVSFLERIEALGRSQGAAVSTASLDIVEESSHINELHISVKASGTLGAVQSVLALLEELPYRSRVTSAVIDHKGVVEIGGEWEGTFAVAVAQYKE